MSSHFLRRATARELAGVGLLALALAWLFLGSLVGAMADALPFNLGDPLLNAWILGWTSDRLAHGLAGVWTAPIFFPYPNTLAYSEHLLGITVLVAPVYWLTGSAILAHNVAIVGSFVIAAVSMYLLGRALTGRRDAALVAAVAFAFCPYRVGGELARVQMMMAAWLPLVMWAVHRYARTGARLDLAAATAAFLLLALSNTYLLYYAMPAILLVVAHGVVYGRARRRLAWREVALAMSIVFAVLMPVGLRYQHVKGALDLARTPAEIEQYSADVLSYGTVWTGSPIAEWLPRDTTADLALFPGFVLLVFAGLAVVPARLFSSRAAPASGHAEPGRPRWPEPPVHRRRSRLVPRGVVTLYGLIATVSFLCSLGPVPAFAGRTLGIPGPYRALMWIMPGLDGFRAPSRFGIVVMLALAAMAAVGAKRLLAHRSVVVRVAIITAVVVGVVAEGYGGPMPIARVQTALGPSELEAYAWLALQPPGAVVELPFSAQAAQLSAGIGRHPGLAYQYATLTHKLPLVNGSSGYTPPLARLLESPGSPLAHPDALPAFVSVAQRIGVRYILVHTARYERPALARNVLAALNESIKIVSARRFGQVTALTVASLDRSPAFAGTTSPPEWKRRTLDSPPVVPPAGPDVHYSRGSASDRRACSSASLVAALFCPASGRAPQACSMRHQPGPTTGGRE